MRTCSSFAVSPSLPTSVLRPQFDGGVRPEALQVLRGQGDDVVAVLLQVSDGVVLKEEGRSAFKNKL